MPVGRAVLRDHREHHEVADAVDAVPLRLELARASRGSRARRTPRPATAGSRPRTPRGTRPRAGTAARAPRSTSTIASTRADASGWSASSGTEPSFACSDCRRGGGLLEAQPRGIGLDVDGEGDGGGGDLVLEDLGFADDGVDRGVRHVNLRSRVMVASATRMRPIGRSFKARREHPAMCCGPVRLSCVEARIRGGLRHGAHVRATGPLRVQALHLERLSGYSTEGFSGLFAVPRACLHGSGPSVGPVLSPQPPNQAVTPTPKGMRVMNTRTTAPVVITVSLVVLMSGCAGAAAQGGQVRDDLRPAANAAEVGLARGHVIAQDALTPNQVVADRVERAIQQAAQSDAARAFSAEARRELHAQSVQAEPGFSADARRELHAGQPVTTTTAERVHRRAGPRAEGQRPRPGGRRPLAARRRNAGTRRLPTPSTTTCRPWGASTERARGAPCGRGEVDDPTASVRARRAQV